MNVQNQTYCYHTKKSNLKGFISIITNYLILIFLGYVVAILTVSETNYIYIGYPILLILLSSCYLGFENLIHEASHYNLFRDRKLNNVVDWLFGFGVFISIHEFRQKHVRHHLFLGNLEKDPEMRYFQQLELNRYSNNIWKFICRPFSGYMTYHYLVNPFFLFWYSPHKQKQKVLYWSILLTLMLIGLKWVVVVLVYILPFFFMRPIMKYYGEVFKYAGQDFNNKGDNVHNYMSGLSNLLLYPFMSGYHAIHYRDSRIPWYRREVVYVHFFLQEKSITPPILFYDAVLLLWTKPIIFKYAHEKDTQYKQIFPKKYLKE